MTLTCSVKNTFVLKDLELLQSMGYHVNLIQSPPFKDPIRFFWNRIREFFLGFLYLSRSQALFSWFNDYHTWGPLFWAHFFGKPSVLIVGGFDAVASPKLEYGLFLKNNLRQYLGKKNYKKAREIWVVHQSLAEGCDQAMKESSTRSGIKQFIPTLQTPIYEVPTAYDSSFWKAAQTKSPRSVLTVANLSDHRTFNRKGIPFFFELAKRLPSFKFTVVGIQNQDQSLGVLPTNVILLGKQSRSELKKIYGEHQYYFQGSLIEGLPNVLCEAMLSECIPIGKAVFGIPDAIGKTGMTFHSQADLDEVVLFLTKENNGLGRLARARIKEKYPIERRENTFKNFLNNIKNHA